MIDDLASAPDPYPHYAALRRRGAHRGPDNRWIVATARDVGAVLLNSAARVVRPHTGVDVIDEFAAATARFSDGPAGEQARSVAEAALSRIRPEQLRNDLNERITHTLQSEQTCDLTVLARREPIAMLAAHLGFDSPRECASAVHLLAAALAPQLGAQQPSTAETASALTYLKHATCASNDSEQSNIAALLFQAYDATAGLVANTVLAASTHRGETYDARALVREAARFDPAAQLTRRIAASDIRLGHVTIPAGDEVVVLIAAANRDPDRFNRPDRFQPGRSEIGFGFGAGRHACPADSIAIEMVSGVVDAVIASGLKPGNANVRYEPRPNLRIPQALLLVRSTNR